MHSFFDDVSEVIKDLATPSERKPTKNTSIIVEPIPDDSSTRVKSNELREVDTDWFKGGTSPVEHEGDILTFESLPPVLYSDEQLEAPLSPYGLTTNEPTESDVPGDQSSDTISPTDIKTQTIFEIDE